MNFALPFHMTISRVIAFICIMSFLQGCSSPQNGTQVSNVNKFNQVASPARTEDRIILNSGYSATTEVISFRKNKSTLANHCRVAECVIDTCNTIAESHYFDRHDG